MCHFTEYIPKAFNFNMKRGLNIKYYYTFHVYFDADVSRGFSCYIHIFIYNDVLTKTRYLIRNYPI